jgi:hypothetical protein
VITEENLMDADIQMLVAKLEAARLVQLQRLVGCDIATSAADLRSLADIQTALTAAREVLEAHQPRLGHGSETAV